MFSFGFGFRIIIPNDETLFFLNDFLMNLIFNCHDLVRLLIERFES